MGRADILDLLEKTMKAMTVRDIINSLDPEKCSVRHGNVSNNVRVLIRQKRVIIISEKPVAVKIKK